MPYGCREDRVRRNAVFDLHVISEHAIYCSLPSLTRHLIKSGTKNKRQQFDFMREQKLIQKLNVGRARAVDFSRLDQLIERIILRELEEVPEGLRVNGTLRLADDTVFIATSVKVCNDSSMSFSQLVRNDLNINDNIYIYILLYIYLYIHQL